MLRYVTLYAMLLYNALRYVLQPFVTLRYYVIRDVTLCYKCTWGVHVHAWRYAYVTLRYVMLHYVTLCYATLRYVTVMLRYVMRYVSLRYLHIWRLFACSSYGKEQQA